MKKLLIFVACLVFLVIGAPAISSAGEISLPDDLVIIPPTEDIPPQIAALSGVWTMQWSWGGLKAELVLEKIYKVADQYEAQIVYGWGKFLAYGIKPDHVRLVNVDIVDHGAKVEVMWGDGNKMPQFRFSSTGDPSKLIASREFRGQKITTKAEKKNKEE